MGAFHPLRRPAASHRANLQSPLDCAIRDELELELRLGAK
jgi:hypothetical protein